MSTKTKNPVKKTWSAVQLLRELKFAQSDAEAYKASSSLKAAQLDLAESTLRDLEKAHAELQKFYAQSQDELHACRERELMRPWWKKLLGLR